MRMIGAGAILAAAFAAGTGSAQDYGNMTATMTLPMPAPDQDLDAAVRAVNERSQADSRARREQRAALLGQQAVARREQARVQADSLASGTSTTADTAADIRDALEKDLEAWREQFAVSRSEWRSMRRTWLPEETSLTATEWAARRLDWFAARDAWIAERGLAGP